MRVKKTTLLLYAAVLISTGCGKKGPLVPAEALVPAAVTDLQVAQKGDYFQLAWSKPVRDARGARLTGLTGFRVSRREVLPPGQDCEQCLGAYQLLKPIDLDYLQDVQHLGALFLMNDTQIQTGKTYQYKVISLKGSNVASRDSNLVRRQKVMPPQPPAVGSRSGATSVVLDLTLPPPVAGTEVVGVNVYRWQEGAVPSPFPLNSSPVTGSSYEDLRLERGMSYSYFVRTVADVAGERVESNPSNQVMGKLTDRD